MKRVVGWKENAALPDLNVKNVIAKVDTGANLASIDASDIKIVSRENVKYVKFKVMKRNNTVRKTSAPLEGYKRIKSSNGDVERRPYIKTTLLMDGISKKIELTLTDRGPMEYTMLIGRKALGKRWVVNPSISFSTSTAPKEKRSKK
ncbi:RimK/LysX family protein [Acidimicrobiia bacterium]|nr:RimK/LysX family protein [Acidimicrobiia bacterium]